MSFYIDASEFVTMGNAFASAGARIPQLTQPRLVKMGTAVRDNARRNIKSKSGRLAGSGKVTPLGTMLVEVRFQAINNGFDYAGAVEFGRGPVRPIRAKVLRFEAGGKTVFTRYAGPAPAQRFLERGLQSSMGQIDREVTALETDIVKAIESAI